LLHAVARFIHDNFRKLFWIYDRRKGWEIWMQAELEYYLVHEYANMDVGREVMVWDVGTVNSQKQVDFVVVPKKGLEYIFELKCFIKGKTENDWKTKLDEDFRKLEGKLISQAERPIKFGLGICPEDAAPPKDFKAYPPGQNRITGLDENNVNRICMIHYRTFGGL
jgi:hypothetical protein